MLKLNGILHLWTFKMPFYNKIEIKTKNKYIL